MSGRIEIGELMKMGRKTKYDTHIRPRFETIRAWKRMGQTEEEIAKNLGVSRATFFKHKAERLDLSDILKSGKSDADAAVVNALYKRAIGYEYEEEKTVGTKQAGKDLVVGRIEKIKKQVAPDVVAQMFYLQNRCSQDWRDRRHHLHSGPEGQPLQAPIIHQTPHIYIPDNGRKRDVAVIAENIKNGRNGRNGRNSRL